MLLVSEQCLQCLRNSGCDLIINVHCSGESASKIGEFINNLKFLSICSHCILSICNIHLFSAVVLRAGFAF